MNTKLHPSQINLNSGCSALSQRQSFQNVILSYPFPYGSKYQMPTKLTRFHLPLHVRVPIITIFGFHISLKISTFSSSTLSLVSAYCQPLQPTQQSQYCRVEGLVQYRSGKAVYFYLIPQNKCQKM